MKQSYISLRWKLIASFLAVILFGGLLSLSFGSKLVKDTIISEAQNKVKYDLQTAWIIYNEKLGDIRQTLIFTARREGVTKAVINEDYETLDNYLYRTKKDNRLDFLNLIGPDGKVILSVDEAGAAGNDMRDDPLVKRALKGEKVSGTQIFSSDRLSRENKDMVQKADIGFISTPKATKRPKFGEGTGMVQVAAVPILGAGRKVLGILYGGVLLNRNYEIVDRVKEAVYKYEKYKGTDIGTATIFMSNLRISTNVMDKKGGRAIGTLVSDEVSRAVLEKGRTWIGRAFVVHDWYITSYEPIQDLEGNIIGMLYVGMLERPYIDSRNRVMLTFTGIACLCVVLLLIILYFSTSRIINPLQNMVDATKKISSGDLSHKINVKSRDEIGHLAVSFNRMTDNLQTANEELVDWGKTLEKKVEERTKEIRDMQHQMIQSEKLASLGKLSASIAHEINNPLGSVLIYSHLMFEEMDEKDENYENVRKIIKETTRCKNIVKDLLEFARSREPRKDTLNINERLENSLDIISKHAAFQNVKITKHLTPRLPEIVADGDQLQQVFMNIAINACEAMDGKGDLTLRTYKDSIGENITVEIKDTGCGISKEVLDRLFEPFFTTKEVGRGTGLGLAVSYGIIMRHSGTIDVESEEGKGTTFTIKLPIKK